MRPRHDAAGSWNCFGDPFSASFHPTRSSTRRFGFLPWASVPRGRNLKANRYVPQALLLHGHLPIFSNAFDVMKHTLKNSRMHIACAHHHHLVAPPFDHINPAERHSTGAGLFEEARHIADAITDERLGASRKRRHHELAIAFAVGLDNFKQEIELIHMVASPPPAFHAKASACFG